MQLGLVVSAVVWYLLPLLYSNVLGFCYTPESQGQGWPSEDRSHAGSSGSVAECEGPPDNFFESILSFFF